MSERVGLLGLGRMGDPIARNLIESGYALTVFNRTAARTAPLVELGATAADRPGRAVSRGGIAVTMLADDAALEEIVDSEGFLEGLAPGGLHVSMSTVSPALARRLAERHAREGSAYVAAPVFGRPDAAAARKLWICLAGLAHARARALPLLRAIGQGVFEFGEDPGAANVVKLAGNFLIAASLEAMGEAWTLAEKNGVPREKTAELFGQTLFACPIYQNYGKAIAQKKFTPAGFRMRLGLKDVSLALEVGDASQTPLPIASLLRDRFLAGLAKGRQDLDWSAIALGASEDAGLA